MTREPLNQRRGHERLTPDNESREIVGRLLSVNVGMPKNVDWRGKTVFTGVLAAFSGNGVADRLLMLERGPRAEV